MSGGVDSSVAAAILREQDYDVVGVAMRLAPEPTAPIAKRRGTCCSHDDFEDARRVAERMDFPFYVIDLRADFAARVVDNFVSEYLGGRTPNPCVMCNREIKFDRLWSRARALNADYVATGHYARIDQAADGKFHLLRAVDDAKDQSYFLFTLGQDELSRTIFPLGAMTKTEVRARAPPWDSRPPTSPRARKSASFRTATTRALSSAAAPRATPPRLDYRYRREAAGRSRWSASIHRRQRRGLGIASGERLYVREIRANSGEVVAGRRDQLDSSGLVANRVSLVDDSAASGSELYVEVKIRYRHRAIPATMRVDSDHRAEIRFASSWSCCDAGSGVRFFTAAKKWSAVASSNGRWKVDDDNALRNRNPRCKVNQYDSAIIESRLRGSA